MLRNNPVESSGVSGVNSHISCRDPVYSSIASQIGSGWNLKWMFFLCVNMHRLRFSILCHNSEWSPLLHFTLVSESKASAAHLCSSVSAAQQKLIVPRCRRKTFGCQAFSVASSSVWNALPDSLRDPELTLDIFRHHLKTYFFTLY